MRGGPGGVGVWLPGSESPHCSVARIVLSLCLGPPCPRPLGPSGLSPGCSLPLGGLFIFQILSFPFSSSFSSCSVSLHGFGACTPRVTCRDMAGQQAAEREPLGTSNMSLVPSWVFALPMPPCILPTILDFPFAGGLRVLDL